MPRRKKKRPEEDGGIAPETAEWSDAAAERDREEELRKHTPRRREDSFTGAWWERDDPHPERELDFDLWP